MSNHDYADAEVKGITRYFPDATSISLLLSSVGIPAGLYTTAPQSVVGLFPNSSITNPPIALLAFCFALAWLILVVLSLHLALKIHHSKNTRIRHYTNHPESMDLGNIIKRFSRVHWFCLVLIFLLGVAIGRYL
jgi:hypothetical protein